MSEVTIAVSDFKARCLRILDDVADRGETVIITKRGKPLARVMPIQVEQKPLKGRWKGRVEIIGDIVNFDTSSEWEALR